jgi:hypothetical protein
MSQPWAWATYDPVADKGIDNRPWPPPIGMIGQRIAVQASRTWDDRAVRIFLDRGITHFPARKALYLTGVIIGVATIDRVITEVRSLPPTPAWQDQARWLLGGDYGEYGWLLTDRITLPTPIKCRGFFGLQHLPPDVEAQVLPQLRAA